VIDSPDFKKLHHEPRGALFWTVRQELKRFERKTPGYSKSMEMNKLAVAFHFGA